MAAITNSGRVIKVVHPMVGTAQNGVEYAGEVVKVVESVRNQFPSVIVYHNAGAMDDASPAYARAFGDAFAKLRAIGGCEHVAWIPKLWLRALATTAASIGGINLKSFKSEADAEAYLRAYGG